MTQFWPRTGFNQQATGSPLGRGPSASSVVIGQMDQGVVAITGTLAVTVPGPTFTLSGAVGVSGILGLNVPPPVVAVAAQVTVTGVLGLTVPAPAVSAAGSVLVSGPLATSTPAPVFAASGAVGAAGITGALAVITPGPTFTLAGAVLEQCALSLSTPSPTAAGSGAVLVVGSAAIAAPGPVLSASGAVTVVGSLSTTTPAPGVAGSASVTVTGGMAGTIPAPTFEALGAILSPLVGVLAATLDDPMFTAQGSSGVVVQQQGGGGGRVYRHWPWSVLPNIQGDLAATLSGLTFSAVGQVEAVQEPVEPAQTLALPAISSQMVASLDPPILASIGEILQVGPAPAVLAVGFMGALPYDDSEDLMVALLLLVA